MNGIVKTEIANENDINFGNKSFKKKSLLEKNELTRKTTLKKDYPSMKPNGKNPPILQKQLSFEQITKKMETFFIGQKRLSHYTVRKQFLVQERPDIKIYYQHVSSTKPSKASIVFIHGACEHSSRYIETALKFVDNSFDVHLYDVRGHGYSSGPCIMIELENVYESLALVLKQIPQGKPVFLMGHSMGGATAFSFLKMNPSIKVAGVITSSAFVDFPKDLGGTVRKKVMSCIPEIFDGLIMNSQLFPLKITRNPVEVKGFVDDRFLFPIVSIRFLKTLMKLSKCVRIYKAKERFNFPVFMLVGEEDKLTRMEYGKKVFDNLKQEDKRFHIFEEGWFISFT